MQLDEARTLLGVDASTDAVSVRRAYMRALKRHSPERDPEGFQRVRAAYEICARFASADEPAVPAPTEPPSPAPEPPDPPAPDDPLAGDARVAEDAAERWQRYDALQEALEGASTDARIERLREELAREPDHVSLRHWLIDELLDADRRDEALAVAREGIAAGAPQFRGVLAALAPDTLSDEELVAVAHEHPAIAFEELLRRGRKGEAARIADGVMARFAAAPHPHIGGALEYVLASCAAGDVERARTLMATLQRALDEAGLGTRLREIDKVRLLLASELLAAWDGLPRRVASILTAALHHHAIDQAEQPLREYAREHAASAKGAADTLFVHAPTLATITQGWLSAPAAPKRAPSASSVPPSRFLVIFAIAAISLTRVAASECSRPTPVSTAEVLRTLRSFESADTQTLCGMDAEVCPHASRLEAAVRDHDCALAVSPASQIQRRLDALSSAAMTPDESALREQQALRRLLERYRARCGHEP